MNLVKKYLVVGVATLFALVGFFLLFGACVGMGDASWNGFQIIFGAKSDDTQVLVFSFVALLALIFVVAGIALIWVDKVPFNNYIAAGLLLVGAILLFCFPQFASLTEAGEKWLKTLNGISSLLGGGELKFTAKGCLIVAGILDILAAGVIGAKDYLNKLVNKYL